MRANQSNDRHTATNGKDSNLRFAPEYRIKVNGENIVKFYFVEVTNLTLEETLDRTGRFSFVVNDPSSRWLDQGLFDLGKKVEVEIGYARRLSSMIFGQDYFISSRLPGPRNQKLEISDQDSSSKFSRFRKHGHLKTLDKLEVLQLARSFDLYMDLPVSEEQALPQANHHSLFEGVIRGKASSIGLSDLRASINIRLTGIENKYSGDYQVEITVHTINESGYLTNFEVRKDKK